MYIEIKNSGFRYENKEDEASQKAYDESSYGFLYQRALSGSETDDLALSFLDRIAKYAIDAIAKCPDIEFTREKAEPLFDEDELLALVESRPFMNGGQFATVAWCKEMVQNILLPFRTQIISYGGTIESYFAMHDAKISVANRIYFHLVENKQGDNPFAFLVTYASEEGRHIPLGVSLKAYKNDEKTLLALLSPIARIAENSRFIATLEESGELFKPISLTAEEAYQFLTEIPVYESAGVYCRIPNFWKQKNKNTHVSAKVGNNRPSIFTLDAILEYEPEIIVGGVKLTKNELKALLESAGGLRLIKGKWVEVDHEKLAMLLSQYETIESGAGLSLLDAMKREMGIGKSDSTIEISNGAWLEKLRLSLLNPTKLAPSVLPQTFKGSLRPYQSEGFSYLNMMSDYNLGACLADDMGLGKTVQVIAHIGTVLKDKEKVLLIVPTSLTGNWEKEFSKFLPSIVPVLLTGPSKNTNEISLEDGGVYITTYPLLSKLLNVRAVNWDLVVLDEAQAIKNNGTAQTKAVKAIKSKKRIAMTGTPVENSTADLWSLFDFLNPGLLGTRTEFQKYTNLLEGNHSYAPLRKVLSPFILRRMKTDKSIISDLPDKIEEKEYPLLSKIQEKLYSSTVASLVEKLQKTDDEGIARKGIVLSSIMQLKQICNHPCQYSGDVESAYKKDDSGKFLLLEEISKSIYERHERMLVFTQFTEVIPALDALLFSVFNQKGLILHGGVKAKDRTALVTTFNDEHYCPYMILSLKAGGIGLNLTAANHVVHFDRWWNPAVENQATDRAFRIGQKKDVVVHTFITKGTIEEKIDELLESKKELSNSILSSSGEGWITELSNDEILSLVRLEGVV